MEEEIVERNIRNEERKLFDQLKQKENQKKKIPTPTEDILYSSSFTFDFFSDSGDSGTLLLATNKKDKHEKYILKHQYYDCACNEFMYSKIGRAMNIEIAPVKLFYMDDKKKKVKTNFVSATPYYEDGTKNCYNDLIKKKDCIHNFFDIYRFMGLYDLLLEGDGVEWILSNKTIYRIDTTDSFTLSELFIHYLAYDFTYQNIDIKKFANHQILNLAKRNPEMRIGYWISNMNSFKSKYGEENLQHYLFPFYQFTKISEEMIQSWVEILTYFYPDIIGEYYLQFCKNLKDDVKIFLSRIDENSPMY